MTTELNIPSDFWETLRERYWEKEPVVFPNFLSRPILTPEETFEAIQVVGQRYVSGVGPLPYVRCYVDGRQVEDGPGLAAFIPAPDDASMQGYTERLSSSFGGSTFGLMINNIQVCSWPLWSRINSFSRDVSSKIGMPAAGMEAILFFGNYETTSFGVHADTANVFTFALENRKRVLLWPRDVLARRGIPVFLDKAVVRADQIERDALALEIGQRDLMYWPPSYFHVSGARGDRAPVASLAVAMFFDAQMQRGEVSPMFERVMNGLMAGCEPLTRPLRFNAGDRGPSLPPELEALFSGLADHLTSAQLRAALHVEWLRSMSCGFLRPPPADAVELELTDLVARRPGSVIHHVELSPGRLTVAVNGHTIETAASQASERLLTALNSGRVATVGELVSEASGGDSQQAESMLVLRGLLNALAGVHAIERSLPRGAAAL